MDKKDEDLNGKWRVTQINQKDPEKGQQQYDLALLVWAISDMFYPTPISGTGYPGEFVSYSFGNTLKYGMGGKKLFVEEGEGETLISGNITSKFKEGIEKGYRVNLEKI